MKYVVKKMMALLLSAVMLLSLLAGCSKVFSSAENSKKKEKVTIALWGNELIGNYTSYLCDSFPDVEFEFILATNSLDYFRYRSDHGDLPDIMTVRRFSLKDAVFLKDKLYDLSNTGLASTYSSNYLDLYTYEDGTVNWLPACAEVDSIIANKTLFEEHHIAVPTDYASFISACEAFEAEGIRGFLSDFGSDYTCLETLQGFSISKLLSMEGRGWRMKYESGGTRQLSEEVWMPVFERFFDMKEKTGLGKPETTMLNRDPKTLYMEGKLAMYRGTGTDVIDYPGRDGDESILLPYFGDTPRDSWYLTYPAFQVAASKSGMENPDREALILEIMTAMLNQEGQNHISYGKNMIPYNRNVNLERLPELENMKSHIDDNKLYIRLASDEMFRISKDVVQKILTGELTSPREAYEAFNALMLEKSTADSPVTHLDTTISNDFRDKGGNAAASAVCNTIRKEAGTDLLLSQACYVGGDVYEGDYTEKEIGYLIKCDGGVEPVVANLTGDQVYQLVEATLEQKSSLGAVCNDSTLYLSSGFEMNLTRDGTGYRLGSLTKDGKELVPEEVYSVFIISEKDWIESTVIRNIGCEDVKQDIDPCREYLKKRLIEEGGRLEVPCDYITLK